MEERLKNLEKENTETTNVLYELQNQIDSLNERLKIIENYTLSDGK